MKSLLKKYIKDEVSKLKYKEDTCKLINVYPSILEEVLGEFKNPYSLNGYDCDYWAKTSKYDICGCMRFGTAEVTLINAPSKEKKVDIITDKEEKVSEITQVITDEMKSWDMFYFTFGSGQFHEGYYQPIKAKNAICAKNKMFELYGTNWCSIYNQDEWNKICSKYGSLYKSLELVYANQ